MNLFFIPIDIGPSRQPVHSVLGSSHRDSIPHLVTSPSQCHDMCHDLLHKISSCAPEKVLINLYYSPVYPNLLNCNIVRAELILPVSRFAIITEESRILTKQRYLAHTDPLFHCTVVHKVNVFHRLPLSIHAFKIRIPSRQS